jgi:hypothetical protein
MTAIGIGLGTATKRDHYRGKFASLAELQASVPVAYEGDRANVDAGSGSDLIQYNWDDEEGWVATASGGGGGGSAGWDPRGNWSLVTNPNLYPNSGGSGGGGAIEAYNTWRVPVGGGGMLNGEFIPDGTIFLAWINAPGQVAVNWRLI